MSNATPKPRSSIASEHTVARVGQFLAFAGAMAVLPMGTLATVKYATSPFEVFAGLVMSGILATAMVIMGLLIPVAIWPERR